MALMSIMCIQSPVASRVSEPGIASQPAFTKSHSKFLMKGASESRVHLNPSFKVGVNTTSRGPRGHHHLERLKVTQSGMSRSSQKPH